MLLPVEKKWLSYQLLSALVQCHAARVIHGDIKSENAMLTTWNWLFLTDFSPYLPVLLPLVCQYAAAVCFNLRINAAVFLVHAG